MSKRRKLGIFRRKALTKDIDPDEIFLDSSNLPKFNTDQFEGHIEKPISKKVANSMMIFFLLVTIIFFGRVGYLQIVMGSSFENRSESNRLDREIIFPERGIIYDRNGDELAWNEVNPENEDFSKRVYIDESGFGHLLGFVDYPSQDSAGFYYEKNIIGLSGVENAYQDILGGESGILLTEIDALGEIHSKSLTERPRDGRDLTLSIDKDIQNKLNTLIQERAIGSGFLGGAGIIMDVNTGEIIAITSYPEFDSNILSDGKDREIINSYNTSNRKPFLNRATTGLYTPGSIVKPFVAIAALEENIIDPNKSILSTGSISIPNPYYPNLASIFKDWKAHGWVDMREAIAVSSNIYFFEIGGGFEDQKGLGIRKIEEYLSKFGFGGTTGINFSSEAEGIIPNPEWKALNFDDDIWRLGDTYNTSIGQYGFQVTPIQAVRAVSAIANGGYLLTPVIEKTTHKKIEERLNIKEENVKIIKEGMRLGVTEGISTGVNVPFVKVAGKTGTAEIGIDKLLINSWFVGFWPYENPKYAFVVMMEKGPRNNLVGSIWVIRQLLDWMNIYKPEYLKT